MSQQIPPSARDALARQAAADDHPSADLLNGFMEHALSVDENARVTTHLAACKDCREIVFLAGAAEEVPQEELVAAPAAGYASVTQRPRRRWTSWRWLAPALAAVVAVAGIAIYRVLTTQSVAYRAVAMKLPSAPPSTQANSSTAAEFKAPAPKLSASTADIRTAPAKKSASANRPSQAPLQSRPSAQVAESETRDMALAASPSTVPPAAAGIASAPSASSEAKPSPTAKSAATANEIMANSGHMQQSADAARSAPQPLAPIIAQPKGGNDITYKSPVVGGAYAMKTRPTSTSTRWRITADGHVERSVPSGEWTRVLAEQPMTFRTVAVIGRDVWAGGSDGALFHSSDGGDQWSRVLLTAAGEQERGAVVSIRFDTASEGRVTTQDGVGWTTSDGGKTWSKQ